MTCDREDFRAVRATRINHVSISATDLEESTRFYEGLFGMERLPTAKFSQPVQWLRLGDQQLHLFERKGTEAPSYHHLGLDVDDFDAVYLKAKELGLLDRGTWDHPLRVHPSGWVQMYIRDPAGNLVEIDWPDASTLDPALAAELHPLEADAPQTGDAADATLYHQGVRSPA